MEITQPVPTESFVGEDGDNNTAKDLMCVTYKTEHITEGISYEKHIVWMTKRGVKGQCTWVGFFFFFKGAKGFRVLLNVIEAPFNDRGQRFFYLDSGNAIR